MQAQTHTNTIKTRGESGKKYMSYLWAAWLDQQTKFVNKAQTNKQKKKKRKRKKERKEQQQKNSALVLTQI